LNSKFGVKLKFLGSNIFGKQGDLELFLGNWEEKKGGLGRKKKKLIPLPKFGWNTERDFPFKKALTTFRRN